MLCHTCFLCSTFSMFSPADIFLSGTLYCMHFIFFYFFYKFIYLFIFGCVGSLFLCEGFLQFRRAGTTLHRACAGLSSSRPLLLRSTGSRRAGSVIVAHGLSCSAACGIFPDQGSNPCPLHWQADSQPLRHQGSPVCTLNQIASSWCRLYLWEKKKKNFFLTFMWNTHEVMQKASN